jgi:hypothetical protein
MGNAQHNFVISNRSLSETFRGSLLLDYLLSDSVICLRLLQYCGVRIVEATEIELDPS